MLAPNSAGVGRTGVFITLSIVLERMRYEGVVDIFQTVKMLRTQRPAMVQTEVRAACGAPAARPHTSAPLSLSFLFCEMGAVHLDSGLSRAEVLRQPFRARGGLVLPFDPRVE